MNFKIKCNNFLKVFNIFFKNIFLNYKTYFFTFILSVSVFVSFLFIWLKSSNSQLLPPTLISLLSTTSFFSSLFIGLMVIDWKKRNYLSKLKIGPINKTNFLFSLFFINLIISLTSFLLNLLIYEIFCSTNIIIINVKILGNLKVIIWIIIFITFILLTFFLTVINLLFSSFFKNYVLSILFTIFFFLFSLFLSDTIIIAEVANRNKALSILGYLNPTKYFIWFNMLISSYSFLDKFGITQIIPNYFDGVFAPFTNIYQTLFPYLSLVILITLFYYFKYKWGYKI